MLERRRAALAKARAARAAKRAAGDAGVGQTEGGQEVILLVAIALVTFAVGCTISSLVRKWIAIRYE